MELRFDGLVALVTGAGSGIGFACARQLAASGAAVAMVGRDPDKIVQASKLLEGVGHVMPFALDVTDGAAVEHTVEEIRTRLGEIDILIQSAGRGMRGGPEEIYDIWERTLALNATAPFHVMNEVVRQSMLPRKTGSIVHIASMAGLRGMLPPLDNFAYCAGKAALIAMTRQAAVVWGGSGIRANAIAPGGVASGGVGVSQRPVRAVDDPSLPYLDLIPSGRHSTAEEVADMACFLASARAGNVNGQVVVIDGGASVIGF